MNTIKHVFFASLLIAGHNAYGMDRSQTAWEIFHTELAIRLNKAHTQEERDIITEHAYSQETHARLVEIERQRKIDEKAHAAAFYLVRPQVAQLICSPAKGHHTSPTKPDTQAPRIVQKKTLPVDPSRRKPLAQKKLEFGS